MNKNPITAKAAIIKQMFGEKTDLTNRLSYANGVKNIVNVKKTNQSIRLRVTNIDVPEVGANPAIPAVDENIYLAPISTIFGTGKSNSISGDIPNGIHFSTGLDAAKAFNTALKIESLNRDQILGLIANEMSFSPMQIIGVSMKSYNDERKGESSNFANSITHYNVSSLRPKRYTDLNLGDFQNTKDFSTDILKVDFIKEGFVAPISFNDFLAFKVNANTVLDITFHIGARDSAPERFYRDITAGTQLLNDSSWNTADSNCSCD